MKSIFSVLFAAGLLASSLTWAQDKDDQYVDIPADLASGMLLLEVAERAHDNTADYFEPVHGHPRNEDHEHGQEAGREHTHFAVDTDMSMHPEEKPEFSEDLSAYDAVGEIWLNALGLHEQGSSAVDPESLDIIKVVIAVIDAWHQCDDTFGAVKRGVELMPDRAAEIAAAVAIKKDCNCAAGGIWPQQRVEERIRPYFRQVFVEVPRSCSCSQAAMFAAISGLPENLEYITTPEEDEAELARITRVMVEKTNEIIERTNAAQNRNDWDCGCAGVNLAASMRGIEHEDLREGTWDGLAEKYVNEAGDSGLVVDAFGIVGLYPMYAWGTPDLNSREFDLRRQPQIYRGDPLLLDPFAPAHEWNGIRGSDFSGLGSHEYSSIYTPTDLFISEYVIGERAIPAVVAAPRNLVKTTITLDSEVTFDLDKYDIRAEASPVLERVAEFLLSTDIISEVMIEGHTCDLASDDYNQLLSERRAQAVKDFLTAGGMDAAKIKTAGLGESRPRLANDSEENRSLNRRVEISFLTREGTEVEKTVSESPEGSRSIELTFVKPADRKAWEQSVQDYETAIIPVVNPDQEFNRAIEIYNGSDEQIDMGQGQYFLEIYGEDFEDARPVAVATPNLRKNTLTIESGVTFDLDKWAIREEASETLQSIVNVINNADIFSEILIVGHTCDIATDEYNQLLSERRAQSVREYLENAGLNVKAIRTEGHGEAEPRLPNTSEENRSQNRRVEITFVTRDDRDIERTVTESDGREVVEFSWTTRQEGVAGAAALLPPSAVWGDEFFVEGEREPREVIGLNGKIEPGQTFVVAYDGSDEELTDLADIVTGQLDFLPNETLVLRRFGGQRALACKAHTYAFLYNYPPFIIPIPEPIRPLPDPLCPDPNNCDDAELGSPN